MAEDLIGMFSTVVMIACFIVLVIVPPKDGFSSIPFTMGVTFGAILVSVIYWAHRYFSTAFRIIEQKQ